MRFLGTYARSAVVIMKTEVQLNVTIDSEVVKSHKLASKLADSTIEKFTEAALCFFYGSKEPEVLALRIKAIDAAKILRRAQPLPFEEAPIFFTTSTV